MSGTNGTSKSQALNLTALADGQVSGSITPLVIRDLTCSVPEIAGGFFNVKAKPYGALMNGVADDATAYNAARTAAGNNGTVVVPPGGVNFTTTPTGGSTSPILWQLAGNSFGTGTTPVNGIGTDTIETTLTGSKFFTRTATIPDAGPVVRIDSSSTNTGGAAGTQSTLVVNTFAANVNTNNFIWGITNVLHSQSTGISQNVALVSYGYKDANGAPVWGANIAAADTTGNGSSTSGALIGNEQGMTANGTDTGGAANDLIPAGAGIRVNLDAVHARVNPAGADAVFGWGVRVGGESTGVSMNYPYSIVNLTVNRAGFTTDMARFAVGADAFRMASNQTIGFDGTAGVVKLYYDTGPNALVSTAPAFLLANATSNRLIIAAAGLGAPTFTTQSAGTKITLFPNLSGSTVDFGIGIESGAMWFSTNVAANNFYWYGGTTRAASLSGGGVFSLIGSYQVSGTQVVGARDTGWGAGTNGSKAAFNASGATLAATAAAVAQVIAALTTHGMIGP